MTPDGDLTLLLLAATLVTSTLSGVLGMGGGMILMGVFGLVLSVPVAMVLHGVTQVASNASRSWIHRSHIEWRVLGPYLAGAGITFAALKGVAFVPGKGAMFLVLGSLPFLAPLMPAVLSIDPERRRGPFACGALVGAFHLLAGVSGPVLDLFFLRTPLGRLQVVGTKALTQTLAHALKLAYYAPLVHRSRDWDQVPAPAWVGVVALAVLGSYLGRLVLERLTDEGFRRACRVLLHAVGILYLYRGLSELLR